MPEAAELVASFVRRRLARFPQRPQLVGLCGAQGSGKTTLAAVLAARFNQAGCRTVVLSLDDLYLGAAERRLLAREVHPMFAVRGVPGTHDVDLGTSLIERLQRPGSVRLPQFDKATDDRAPESTWPVVEAPADLILFEGWCVSARPQQAAELTKPINALEATRDSAGVWRGYVNEALTGPYQRLFAPIDLLVFLAAPSFEIVRQWRGQQEDDLRKRSRVGATGLMNPEQIDAFIQHYERLTRHILAEMPSYADHVLCLDESRNVVAAPNGGDWPALT
ncbi:kinase [Sphingosinicellaceae bacterium]|nr:kinase [Sphingosinicellaceae bacterium]